MANTKKFPYYLVYFKAVKRDLEELPSPDIFPYYLVYFKAWISTPVLHKMA